MKYKSLNLACFGLMTIATTTLVFFTASTKISARANEVKSPVTANRQADGSLGNKDTVNPVQLIQQGQTAITDRNWGKAETIWQQVIQLQPNNADAYSNLCEAFARQDKIEPAKAQCHKAIELDPKLANAYYSRGFLKGFKLNDSSGSLADYNKAILLHRDSANELDPKVAEVYYARAYLKSNKLNDVSGSLVDYNKAIELDPKHANAYNNRAELKYQNLNDNLGALADYSKAIELYPNSHAMAYKNRGFLKGFKLNDIPGALADFDRAIAISPKFAHAYAERADLKEQKMQDRAGAIQDYRQAVKFYREEGEMADVQKTIEKLRKLGALA
jgi:tetratricopeptide (TPR) repeat protein